MSEEQLMAELIGALVATPDRLDEIVPAEIELPSFPLGTVILNRLKDAHRHDPLTSARARELVVCVLAEVSRSTNGGPGDASRDAVSVGVLNLIFEGPPLSLSTLERLRTLCSRGRAQKRRKDELVVVERLHRALGEGHDELIAKCRAELIDFHTRSASAATSPVIPYFIPAEEFLKNVTDVRSFMIEGLIPDDGVGIELVGAPRQGKSTNLAVIIRAVIAGDQFLGRNVNGERFALWIDNDTEVGELKRRVLAVRRVTDEAALKRLSVWNRKRMGRCWLNDAKCVQAVKDIVSRAADESGRHVLIALDSLRASIPKDVKEKDEQFAEITREAVETWQAAGANVIAIHHANRDDGGGTGVARSRGNSAVPAVFGGYFYIDSGKKSADSIEFTLHQDNRWGKPEPIRVHITLDHLVATEKTSASKAEPASDDLESKALQELTRVSPRWVTSLEVVKAIGVKATQDRTVRRRLENLVAAGHAEERQEAKKQPKQWRLTPIPGGS